MTVHNFLIIGTSLSLCLAFGAANSTTLNTSTYFQAESSNNDRGLTCGSFSNFGAHISCIGTRYYYNSDNDRYIGYDYSAEASATAGSLKTRTSLSNRAPVKLSNDDEFGYYFSDTGEALDDSFDENFVEFDWDAGIVGEFVFDYVFTDEAQYYSAYASARLRDTLTVHTGATGEAGQIKLSYDLDGTNMSERFFVATGLSTTTADASSSNNLSIYESGVIGIEDGVTITGRVNQGTTISTLFNETRNETVDLYLDIVFGSSFDLNVGMSSASNIDTSDLLGNMPLFSTSSEFFGTAVLSDISVLDSSGIAVDFFLESASNEAIFESFSTLSGPPTTGDPDTNPVPLPSAAFLLLAGLSALGWTTRLARKAA